MPADRGTRSPVGNTAPDPVAVNVADTRWSVVDVEDLDRAIVEIDAIYAPPRAQATGKRPDQWLAHPERVLS
jgi:hypothetical protein